MIVGIKENDKVVLGFSSWVPLELSCEDALLEDNLPFKIFQEEGIIVACAERKKSSDAVFANKEVEKQVKNSKKPYEDIINIISPMIKDIQKQNNYLTNAGKWSNSLTIVKKENVWDIPPSFFVKEVTDYFTHSYETTYVKSRLHYNKEKPSEERIVDAIRFHGQMTQAIVYPIIIVNSKDYQIKIINE